MLSKSDVEKIKDMAKFIENQQIADVYNVPVNVIEDVLRGNITGSESEANQGQTKIRVVEKARYVHNKTVCATSPGGGKGNTTLLTTLAVTAAINNPTRRPVVILDLAEFSKVPAALGIDYRDIIMDTNSIMDWENANWQSFTIGHPVINNLFIVPGVTVADSHQKISLEKMVNIIETLQRNFEMTFIDLPTNLHLTKELLPYADTVLITLTPDNYSLEGLAQFLPTLNYTDTINKSLIVLNRVGHPGLLSASECRKALKEIYNSYTIVDQEQITITGILPECESILKYLNRQMGENIIIKDPQSDFTKEIQHILGQLRPDWQLEENKKNGGITSAFSRLLKRS